MSQTKNVLSGDELISLLLCSSGHLYSFVQPKDKMKPCSSSLMAVEELQKRQEEQAEILKMDDIVEDDDDDSSIDDDVGDRFRLEISEPAPTNDFHDTIISSSNFHNCWLIWHRRYCS